MKIYFPNLLCGVMLMFSLFGTVMANDLGTNGVFRIEYRAPIVGTRYHYTCKMKKETEYASCDSGWAEIKSTNGMVVRTRTESEEYTSIGIFLNSEANTTLKARMLGLWPLTNSKKYRFEEKQKYQGKLLTNKYEFEVLGREIITTPAGTFNCVKVKRTIFYAASETLTIVMNWWDPVSGIIIISEDLNESPESSAKYVVDKITRKSIGKTPAEDKRPYGARESNICTFGSDEKPTCMNPKEFRSLLTKESRDESVVDDPIERFRKNAISYQYPKKNFDRLLIKALSKAGYTPNPAYEAGAYIETNWRVSEGRKTPLKHWSERSRISALVTKDLFSPDIFWVLLGASIEESPDNLEWTQVDRQDALKNRVDSALRAINITVKEAGGSFLGRRF